MCAAAWVAGGTASLQTPPGGELVARLDKTRVYWVPGDTPENMRTLKAWAAKWGARSPGMPYSGYGGDLAAITIDTEGTVRFADGRSVGPPPKGKLRVVVTDQPWTLQNVWLRITTLLR